MKLVVFCFLGLGLMAFRQGERRTSARPSAGIDESVSDNCKDHFHFDQGTFSTVLDDEEVRTVAAQAWKISQPRGGVVVTTWDRPEFSVRLCKRIAVNDQARGRKILSEIKLAIDNSTIAVESPGSGNDYLIADVLLIKAPQGAGVSVKIGSGGAVLKAFSGNAEVEIADGGVVLARTTGKITVDSQHGGVSITDCDGDITAKVRSGGINMALPAQWSGKGLEAWVNSGGLTIAVPPGFDSGLEVSSATNYNMICGGRVCEKLSQTREGQGRWLFRLGGGSPKIRAGIDNGGISIQDRE